MHAHADRADRVLAAAITLLPARHRQWGAAMRAELATVRDRAERTSFAWSCVRAICATPRAMCGLLSRAAVGAIVVAAGAFMTKAAPGVAIQAGVLFVVLVGLSIAGMRDSRMGPVGENAVAGCWRMTGYLTVGSLLLWLLQPRSGGPPHDPGGFWIAALLLIILFAAHLCLTARARPRTLLVVGGTALGAAALWSALMLTSAAVRAAPLWRCAVIAVAGAVAAGACYVTRSAGEVALAGAGAVFAASVLIFLAAGLTLRAAPSLAPNVAGSGIAGGLTTADRRETNRNEAIDPYLTVLLIGALAGLVLVGSTGPTPAPKTETRSRALSGSTL
ncbi:MAG TPA: hypothetical protein VFU35_12785 [Jatrophihabitans sp.]|nr:hypothetical protein [Jatrophihabitans sp.]